MVGEPNKNEGTPGRGASNASSTNGGNPARRAPGTEVRATIALKVLVNQSIVDMAQRYMNGKRLVLWWLLETSKTKISISAVHAVWYQRLKEMGLNPALARDCYRDAYAVYKGWVRNPKKGRFPILRKVSVWLSPGQTYKIDLKNKKAMIRLGNEWIEVPIIGWPKTLEEYYRNWEVREARLVIKNDNEAYLKVMLLRRSNDPRPSGSEAIAVDINAREVVYGNPSRQERLPTRIEDALHLMMEAEGLKRKYGKKHDVAEE
ncbi:hypothetical protein [Vulcanisaeta thermophila]|uniref:hypothetical protein n=1 Tax=Vulcanisaeta thermophila TaxID=867917 RepID=UPI000A00A682|nr:hypothetical protein [Vulcanisaeta thermophila]